MFVDAGARLQATAGVRTLRSLTDQGTNGHDRGACIAELEARIDSLYPIGYIPIMFELRKTEVYAR